MVRVTDGVMDQDRRWRSAAQNTRLYFERAISTRAIPPLKDQGPDLTEHIAAFRITGEVVRQARERAEQLRTTFSDVSRALDAMLEMEQQEERERHERTQRLNPFPLPLSLCYFRYVSRHYVARSIVSEFEFEQVLNGYGFEDSEVAAIDQWVEKWGSMGARDLMDRLRELGVTAMHPRPIQAPGEA